VELFSPHPVFSVEFITGVWFLSFVAASDTQPEPTNMKTIRTTTTEMFTPDYDPSTGQKFKGSHSAFLVIVRRDGDSVTETHLGDQGFGPVRPVLAEYTHSISQLIEDGKSIAADCGCVYECIDDLPEGTSYPSAIA
jgi:hypothetical protein